MASSVPIKKNTNVRIVFPIFDSDGDLVSSAAGLDSNYSIDGGTFSDCTNEAQEIGSSGMYYLDLLASEVNGDVIAILVNTTTVGAKSTPLVLYTAAQTIDELYNQVAIIRKISTGRWRITGNQMIFYDDDEVTPIYTFNLKDSAGQPSSADIFERDPV
jgi:hypothetical protein